MTAYSLGLVGCPPMKLTNHDFHVLAKQFFRLAFALTTLPAGLKNRQAIFAMSKASLTPDKRAA